MLLKEAFWIAAAAVLEKEGALSASILRRWHDCVKESNDPHIVGKILDAASPDMVNLPLIELVNVAATLLDKRAHDGIVGHSTEMLEPLRAAFLARPGLLIFAAETIKLWLSFQQLHQQQRAYMRAVEIFLWLAEVSTSSLNQNPAFTSYANLLALPHQPNQPHQPKSILATIFHHFYTFPLGAKLQAMKLIGLCCQNSYSSAFYTCWQPLEHILCTERNEEVLHITSCALFESIVSHSTIKSTPANSNDGYNNQLRATDAIENGLACPMPCIQFPAAVAAGKLLLQRQVQWEEVCVERVATAADQAYRIQQDRFGPWSAWQLDSAAGAAGSTAVLQVPSSPKLVTSQHVLAVLEIVHQANTAINRET